MSQIIETSLRVLCGEVITHSEIDTKGKLSLLNYIKEHATEHQLKAFLLVGEVVAPRVAEGAKESIDKNFNKSKFNDYLSEAGIAANILGILLVGTIGWTTWRAAASIASKAHRRCGTLNISQQRDSCICKVRISECERKLKILHSAASKCNKSKQPIKCKLAGEKLIAKEQSKLQKQKTKLQKLTMKGRGYGEPGVSKDPKKQAKAF